MSTMSIAEEKGSGLSILKIIVGIIWVAINVIIFVLAPIFIVSIILSFGIPLNMPIVYIVYTLGFIAVGFSGLMSWFKYGTRERAITALCYTGVVIGFLLIVLTHLGGGFAEIRIDLTGVTLRADIALFSYIILATMVIYGVIYSVELLAVLKERERKIYTYLKAGSAVCIFFFLITASFFMILTLSATQIGGSIGEYPAISYNNNGTFFFYDDDTLDFTYNISISNGGSFKIQDITFEMYLYLNDTTSIILTPGILLGSGIKTIESLEAGQLFQDNITIGMDPSYLVSFILTNNTIKTLTFISANVVGLLPVAINTTNYWISTSILYPQT
ncbi:MAG: hypothetical protein HWN65_19540 [Candidatus Helarchaeota archaeon]|nr:hypothetical protein [Candidatus Helarchaeota archaeon]